MPDAVHQALVPEAFRLDPTDESLDWGYPPALKAESENQPPPSDDLLFRWRMCSAIAVAGLQEPLGSEQVWSATRALFYSPVQTGKPEDLKP